MILLVLVLVLALVPSYSTSQTTETSACEYCHSNGHGRVYQIKGQSKGQTQCDPQPVGLYEPMVDIALLALATFHHERVDAPLEVDMGATFETHVVVAHGTDNVIAPPFLFNGNLAVATGFAMLVDDSFRFQRIIAVVRSRK